MRYLIVTSLLSSCYPDVTRIGRALFWGSPKFVIWLLSYCYLIVICLLPVFMSLLLPLFILKLLQKSTYGICYLFVIRLFRFLVPTKESKLFHLSVTWLLPVSLFCLASLLLPVCYLFVTFLLPVYFL